MKRNFIPWPEYMAILQSQRAALEERQEANRLSGKAAKRKKKKLNKRQRAKRRNNQNEQP
jgi:hypothetical protein